MFLCLLYSRSDNVVEKQPRWTWFFLSKVQCLKPLHLLKLSKMALSENTASDWF